LFERILLRGLARQDVARFIEGATGTAPAPGLADAVYRETEGNPFFTHEVVRLLAQEGRLGRTEGKATWSHAIPQGVREVVGHRLDALSEGCNTLMATASAFGREFDLHVLARVSELSEDAALEHIEEALAAQLLAELPESIGRYQFSHALVQQTLYEEHSTARRVRLHRRVGEALEEIYAAHLEPVLAALAYHFGEAAPGGNVAKAVDYAERAARQAADSLAHEDAVLHYQRALQAVDLLQPDDPERRCALLLDLADAQYEAGDTVNSAVSARAAADVARRSAHPLLFGRAAITAARAAGFDDIGSRKDQPLLEEALERLPDDAVALRAWILASLAVDQAFEADERADATSLQAVALARESGGTRAMVDVLNARYAILNTPGHSLAERVEVIEELTRYDPNYEVTRSVQSPSTRFHLALAQGKGAQAQAALDDMARRAAELRSEPALLSVRALRGQLALLRGDFAGCEEAIKTILRTRDPSPGFGARIGHASGMIYGVHRERGTLGEIERQLDANMERIDETTRPVFHASRIVLYTDVGRLEDARRELEDAVDAGYFNARMPNWLPTLGFLGEACARVGDKVKAATLYERLEPYAESNIQLGSSVWTPISRILGLLAATLGRHEAADRYFTTALDMCERLQSLPLRARTELDYAEMLHARGAANDRKRVRELVSSSLGIAEQLGMSGLVKRALKLKLESDGILSTAAGSSIESLGSLVAEQRPNLSAHAATDGTVTLLFSDLEDYTGLLERLGDVAAHQLVAEHNAIVQATTRTHQGQEVELRGDGFLLAFADPDQALRCAIALQRAFVDRNTTAQIPMRIRIGLHTGETIRDADSFFGRSVVAAFRIADLAAGGEILVSQAIRAAVDAAEFAFDAGRDVTLKGFDGRQTLFSVGWQ
jgi:class 3 adenylate cyclase